MILRRFYEESLAQASYLIGCSATGEALIVDPNRAIEPYLDAARSEGLRITHVTETHIHADFMSGLRELCAKTGATAYLSGAGDEAWQYRFAIADGATVLKHGDSFMVGNIRIEVLHTPGHTPEHLTFLVTDTAGADRPMGAVTGDFIFAGDVGRPDLLERAAGVTGTMDGAARQLYASIQSFKQRPDYLQLWPGHGSGSACGKALGAVPQTTLGYERLFNWAFAEQSEAQFIETVLDGQPAPPTYFAQMKRVNRDGPPLLSAAAKPQRLSPDALLPLIDAGTIVVDTRPWKDYAADHIPGTISIPLNKAFINWSGWLLPYDRDIAIVASDIETAQASVRALSLIGVDRVTAIFDSSALGPARAAGRVGSSAEIDTRELRETLRDPGAVVLDVRNQDEWDAGHVPVDEGAQVLHIPLGQLERRMAEVPQDRHVVVHCKAGGRSAIATSLLERRGYGDVANVRGGFDSWMANKLAREVVDAG
jgi:hydroxyacylglutathione hydrolase